MKLQLLKNLGTASARMLEKAGICSEEELRRSGSVRAWLAVRESGAAPSLNLLWAIEGALTGEHWADLSQETRSALLLELDLRMEEKDASS